MINNEVSLIGSYIAHGKVLCRERNHTCASPFLLREILLTSYFDAIDRTSCPAVIYHPNAAFMEMMICSPTRRQGLDSFLVRGHVE